MTTKVWVKLGEISLLDLAHNLSLICIYILVTNVNLSISGSPFLGSLGGMNAISFSLPRSQGKYGHCHYLFCQWISTAVTLPCWISCRLLTSMVHLRALLWQHQSTLLWSVRTYRVVIEMISNNWISKGIFRYLYLIFWFRHYVKVHSKNQGKWWSISMYFTGPLFYV